MSSSDIVKHGIAASADSASLREWFRRYGLTKGHYLRGASSRRDALTSLEALGYGPRAAALEGLKLSIGNGSATVRNACPW
jgi:hypothetical protein